MKIIAILASILLAFFAIGYIILGIFMCTVTLKELNRKVKFADAIVVALLFFIAFFWIYHIISLIVFYS